MFLQTPPFLTSKIAHYGNIAMCKLPNLWLWSPVVGNEIGISEVLSRTAANGYFACFKIPTYVWKLTYLELTRYYKLQVKLRVTLSQKLLNLLSATSSPYGGDLFHLLSISIKGFSKKLKSSVVLDVILIQTLMFYTNR